MIRQQTRLRMPVDVPLFVVTLALVVIGLWMVFDSSYPKALDSAVMNHDAYFFAKRQAGGAVAGLFCLFCFMHTGYWNLKKYAVGLMFAGIVLLLAVYAPHIGVYENNAARWLKFGPVKFQPSEVAKLLLMIYAASFLSRPNCNPRDLSEKGLGPLLAVAAFYLLLIEREPDLGTAAVLFLAFMTQLFLAGARKRHIALILGVCGMAVLADGFPGSATGAGVSPRSCTPNRTSSGIGYQLFHSRLRHRFGRTGRALAWDRAAKSIFCHRATATSSFATYAEELGLWPVRL